MLDGLIDFIIKKRNRKDICMKPGDLATLILPNVLNGTVVRIRRTSGAIGENPSVYSSEISSANADGMSAGEWVPLKGGGKVRKLDFPKSPEPDWETMGQVLSDSGRMMTSSVINAQHWVDELNENPAYMAKTIAMHGLDKLTKKQLIYELVLDEWIHDSCSG